MVGTKQAAKRLHVSSRQVIRYVKAGILEANQFGDYPTAPWIITEESLEKFVAERENRQNLANCPDNKNKIRI